MTWIDTDPVDLMPCCASGIQVDCLSIERGSIPLQGAKEERVQTRPLHTGLEQHCAGRSQTGEAPGCGPGNSEFESRRSAQGVYTGPRTAAHGISVGARTGTGADCKSVRLRREGSNPSRQTKEKNDGATLAY